MNEDSKILMGLKNNQTYQIPQGYFESLAANILLRVKSQSRTFVTPNNYFHNLANNILAKVKVENKSEVYTELQQIAPLLNTISKNNSTYKLPENYFQVLSPKINYKESSKVVSIKKVYKYAVAAAFIGFISLVYFTKTINQTNNNIAMQHNIALKTDVLQEIASLQDVMLNNAVENDKVSLTNEETVQNTTLPFLGSVQEEIEQLSDEELYNYLSNNNITTEKEISDINS